MAEIMRGGRAGSTSGDAKKLHLFFFGYYFSPSPPPNHETPKLEDVMNIKHILMGLLTLMTAVLLRADPNPWISVDGYDNGTTITRPYGGSVTVTVRYYATDPDDDLSGIRYNVWNANTWYFDNGGGGFIPQSGSFGEVDQTVTLDSDGDWYFWTDAQNSQGGSSSSGPWTDGFHLTVVQAPNQPPNPSISVDGYNSGATVIRPFGGSVTVTVHYAATDPDGNLSGIRYNIWRSDPWYFDNGGGFISESGGSGEVVKTFTLSSDGDWYFWTDAQDSQGASASTGPWYSGFHLTVAQPPNQPPSPSISVDDHEASGDTVALSHGSSLTVTVHYAATDSDANLSGIRYNIWNPNTGYFDNGGGGFASQSGNSGQVTKTFTISNVGDWYFWTDAQDSAAAYASTGAWTNGFKLSVVPASQAKKGKYVAAYYSSWFDSTTPWDRVWGGAEVYPSIGRYISNYSTGVQHAQELRNMGVDLTIMDSTNNTTWSVGGDNIFQNALSIAAGFNGNPKIAFLLSISNSEGGILVDANGNPTSTPNPNAARERFIFDTYPQTQSGEFEYPDPYDPNYTIRTVIPYDAYTRSINKVAAIYQDYQLNPGRYFIWDGKPLLCLYTTASGQTYGADGTGVIQSGQLPDSWNPIVPGTSSGIRDLFTLRWVGAFVSKSNNSAYVDTTLPQSQQTIAINGNWSWEDTYPQTWARRQNYWGDVPETLTVSAFVRGYAGNPELTRNGGVTYGEEWARAFDIDPLITVIHTFNEFSSTDEYSAERSQSIETNNFYPGSAGGNYESYTKNYIGFFKSHREDIGAYSLSNRAFWLKNRTNDYLNPSSIEFDQEMRYLMDRGANVQVFSADFNNDGFTDVALWNKDDGTVAIRFGPLFRVEATADTLPEKVINLLSGSNFVMCAGDVDDDGFADLIVYDESARRFQIFYNDGQSNFSANRSASFSLDVGSSVQLACASIDGIGADIVVRKADTGQIVIALNNGDGFRTAPNYLYYYDWSSCSGTQYQLLAADFNGDGLADLGLRNSQDGVIYLRFNQKMPNQGSSNWLFDSANEKTFPWYTGSDYQIFTGDFR